VARAPVGGQVNRCGRVSGFQLRSGWRAPPGATPASHVPARACRLPGGRRPTHRLSVWTGARERGAMMLCVTLPLPPAAVSPLCCERLRTHATRPARVRARVRVLLHGSETQIRMGKRSAFFFPAPAAGPRCASFHTLPGGSRSPRRSAPCPHCPGPRYPRAPCGTTLSGTGFILVPGCIPWAAVPSRGPRYPREAVPLRNLRLPVLGRVPVQAPPLVRVPSHPRNGLAWVSPAVGCTHGGGAVGAPRRLDLAGAVDMGRGALSNWSIRPHNTPPRALTDGGCSWRAPWLRGMPCRPASAGAW